MTFSLTEAFITIFIGMGPVKVLLIYIAKTQGMDKALKRRMATRIVIVAGSVAVGLFILGAFLQQVLHFSIGALNIIGGLILLLLAFLPPPPASLSLPRSLARATPSPSGECDRITGPVKSTVANRVHRNSLIDPCRTVGIFMACHPPRRRAPP